MEYGERCIFFFREVCMITEAEKTYLTNNATTIHERLVKILDSFLSLLLSSKSYKSELPTLPISVYHDNHSMSNIFQSSNKHIPNSNKNIPKISILPNSNLYIAFKISIVVWTLTTTETHQCFTIHQQQVPYLLWFAIWMVYGRLLHFDPFSPTNYGLRHRVCLQLTLLLQRKLGRAKRRRET